MNVRLTVVVCMLAAAVPSADAQANRLDSAAWLAGCWEQRTAGRVTYEMWMPPAGDLMIGGSRTVAGGATREFEHLRIRARGDTLVYTAIPSGQRETDFRSTTVMGDMLVFENRAHDFPQQIAYRRFTPDSIAARVAGPGPDNTTRAFVITYRRVNCTTPSSSPGDGR